MRPEYLLHNHIVAPLAGAWIEISCTIPCHAWTIVAPLAGAWIEIKRKRDIKDLGKVAPLAGAWIEIKKPLYR